MIDKFVKLHQDKFPEATPLMQLNKFNEEMAEYQTANTHEEKLLELGDVLLVIMSLFRWEETRIVAKELLTKYYYGNKNAKFYLNLAILKIQQRDYYFENGEYRRNK